MESGRPVSRARRRRVGDEKKESKSRARCWLCRVVVMVDRRRKTTLLLFVSLRGCARTPLSRRLMLLSNVSNVSNALTSYHHPTTPLMMASSCSTPQIPQDVLASLLSASSSKPRPASRVYPSDSSDQVAALTRPDGRNASHLYCPRDGCGCLILRAGDATLAEGERNVVSTASFLAHIHLQQPPACLGLLRAHYAYTHRILFLCSFLSSPNGRSLNVACARASLNPVHTPMHAV